MKNVFFLITLIVSNAAYADTTISKILNHPIVTTFVQLMQDKHQQKCVIPTEGDIHWFCMGAIPSTLKEPTILSSGCFFNISFSCETETVSINGSNLGYYIMMPDGSQIHSRSSNNSEANQIEISSIRVDKTKGN